MSYMSRKKFQEILPDLYLFKDTCNVYLLREKDKAIAIDFGSGDVLKRLPEIGIKKIDWVLHTHHHREQCQGDHLLRPLKTKIGVPSYERTLFSNPLTHWEHPEELSVHGAPFVRPLRQGVKVDRSFVDGDSFKWGKYHLSAYKRPGNSHGAMSFSTKIGGKNLVFCGDLIVSPSKLHNYYDSEWDYGYAEGFKTLLSSLRALQSDAPDILCPSHGRVITSPERELSTLIKRLERFVNRFLLRDWDLERNPGELDRISQPTEIPGIRRVTEHIFKGRGYGIGCNLYILLSDSGRALFIDCGVMGMDYKETIRWLDDKIEDMKHLLGLKKIVAVIPTQYHGDHLLQIPHLVKKYGAQVWCYHNFKEMLESPERFNLTGLVNSYDLPFNRIKVHRVLNDGEEIVWENFRLKVFHLPGQTEFSAGIAGKIDRKTIVFSGDNIFYSPDRSGHDAFVARNGGILEKGYIKCAQILSKLQPDLILGGHAQEIPNPKEQLELFLKWSYNFRRALKQLSHYKEYEYFIDPYWVSFYPYRKRSRAGRAFKLDVCVTNHKEREVPVYYRLMIPQGWEADPQTVDASIPPKDSLKTGFRIRVPSGAKKRAYALTADVVFDDEHVGEIFDCVVEVT